MKLLFDFQANLLCQLRCNLGFADKRIGDALRVERRDELAAHLKAQGIGHAVYYPVPLHRQECFAHLRYAPGSLPETERACREVISLPIYPELTPAQLGRVIDVVRAFYR